MDVREAVTDPDLEQVRRLFRAFVAWHRERHTDDLALIDAYFDAEAWERELAGLPGEYARPDGRLLLAWETGLAIGCAALRRVDDEACELKRMFVVSMARGLGAGRALAEAALAGARETGYRTVLLDTSVRQTEAITLYRDLGFVETAAYHDVPEEMRDWLVFFRRDL